MITILVKNLTTVLTDLQVEAVLPPLQKQLDRDLCPSWNLGQFKLVFVPKSRAVKKGEWQVNLLDHTGEAGALGYHDTTAHGDPITYVGVKDTTDDGGSWTVTLSHELCEMAVNPKLNDSEFNDAQNRLDIKEVCDAVEADELGYTIEGVLVSDFVLPGWFDPDHPPAAKLSYAGHVTAPYQLAAGGYISFIDLNKPQAGWQQVFARHPGHAERKRPGTSRGALRERVRAQGGMKRESTAT